MFPNTVDVCQARDLQASRKAERANGGMVELRVVPSVAPF